MQRLRIIETTASFWGLQHAMPSVLHAPGVERSSEQATSSCNAGRDSAHTQRTWEGRDFGVRAPEFGETPLSLAEIEVGADMGLFDLWPVRRVIRPAGTWERKNINLMAKPALFEGLM